MWKLLKAEFEYNNLFFWFLGGFFPIYTVFTLTDTQLLTGPEWEIDYWGAIVMLLLYLFYYTMWQIRLKEFRLRQQTLLPVTRKQTALARLHFLLFPIMLMLSYLIILHFIIISDWYLETASIISVLGIFLIVFSCFIVLKDIWHSLKIKNLLLRIFIMILSAVPLLLFISFLFFKGRLIFYDLVGFNYGRLVFPLSGLIIGLLSLFSIRLRKSFFS